VVLRVAALCALIGCAPARPGEDPSAWFDSGEQLEVTEPVGFTSEPYDFPADDATGIGTLIDQAFPVTQWSTGFAAGDGWAASGCEQETVDALPFEIEGIVTIHPRYYTKTYGCDNGDEKYYGSFFIEDRTGGLFVLGDSKVAHFDMGDRVKMKVRAIRTSYDLNHVYSHDIIDVQRVAADISYVETSDPLGLPQVGRVHRVSGVVTSNTSTFGEFSIEADNGTVFDIQLDVEINRRGVRFDVGQRITVTGPVLYAYSIFSIVVMRVGQVQVHD
jgi:hypothetical protein